MTVRAIDSSIPPPAHETRYAVAALALYIPAAALWMTIDEQTT